LKYKGKDAKLFIGEKEIGFAKTYEISVETKKMIDGMADYAINSLIIAKYKKTEFDSYVEAGFTVEQAMYLVKR